MYFNIPENIKNIIAEIENAGFEAYIVGGCVRDMLLGITPSDFDITTSATPEQIKEIFCNTVDTGIKHGTVAVLSEGALVEITTYRTECGYSDLRHPEKVSFVSDIREDLMRRDFTVNAMAYNQKSGLLDYFGGTDDLKNGILRTVGKPELRFSEDALRILRLFRFSSVLGFKIEPDTLSAALKLAGNLSSVSCERISQELKKTVNGKNVAALSPLIKRGALDFLFISYDRLAGIEALPSPELRLFGFLYNCSTSPIETAEVLKFSKKEVEYILSMSELLSFEIFENKIDIKYALRESEAVFDDYLDFFEISVGKPTEKLRKIYGEIKQNREPYRIEDLKIDGNDIKQAGFSGKKIGYILNFLLEKVIAEPSLNTKEKLLSIIKN